MQLRAARVGCLQRPAGGNAVASPAAGPRVVAHQHQQLWQHAPLHQQHKQQQQQRRSRAGPRPRPALIDTEIASTDAWALEARAAMLGLKLDQLEQCIQANPDNVWLALCEPERLFALKGTCELLELDLTGMLELLQQQPDLLDVPCTSLEANFRGLQALLQLPRPQLLPVLRAIPGLLLQGPTAVEAQVARAAASLGVPAGGPDGARLLQLLPQLSADWALDATQPVQQVQAFARALCLDTSAALIVLQAEQLITRDPAGLLADATVKALADGWRGFCEDVGVAQRDVMAALAAQMAAPGSRYSIRSVQQLREDLAGLQAACQLEGRQVLDMLLAAPGLVAVPPSFFRLLLQYVLFLVPQWRYQLEAMTPGQAGSLLMQLCEATSGCDRVPVTNQDGLFASADPVYNSELSVLEALLDEGVQAPVFEGPGQIVAAKLWRLLYLCNPRLAAQQRQQQQQQLESAVSSSSSSSSSAWSWVGRLQLPRALVDQLQQRGALSCTLPGAGATLPGPLLGAAAAAPQAQAAPGAGAGAEAIEGLWEVAAADAADFIARHPGYPHWLHNASFELEWRHSKAAAPAATWDP